MLSISEHKKKIDELETKFLNDMKAEVIRCIDSVDIPVKKLGNHMFSVHFKNLSSNNWCPEQFDKELLIKRINECTTLSGLMTLINPKYHGKNHYDRKFYPNKSIHHDIMRKLQKLLEDMR